MCLIKNSAGNSFSQEADSYKNPGHSWTADDQCRVYYGVNASFCHVIKYRILFKFKFYFVTWYLVSYKVRLCVSN